MAGEAGQSWLLGVGHGPAVGLCDPLSDDLMGCHCASVPPAKQPRGLTLGRGSRPCCDIAVPLPQIIDCSMAVQEEPKEPHVSSVLPWIILHRIIWQEEDAFRSLCQQQQLQSSADEGGEVGLGWPWSV